MPTVYCALPLLSLNQARIVASNQPFLHEPFMHQQCSALQTANVRLLRRHHELDTTRFVLTGRLSDVCAALDAMAAFENRTARRTAMQ